MWSQYPQHADWTLDEEKLPVWGSRDTAGPLRVVMSKNALFHVKTFCPSLLSLQVRNISPCKRLAFTLFVSLTPIRIILGSQDFLGVLSSQIRHWLKNPCTRQAIRKLPLFLRFSCNPTPELQVLSLLIHTSRESRSRKPLPAGPGTESVVVSGQLGVKSSGNGVCFLWFTKISSKLGTPSKWIRGVIEPQWISCYPFVWKDEDLIWRMVWRKWRYAWGGKIMKFCQESEWFKVKAGNLNVPDDGELYLTEKCSSQSICFSCGLLQGNGCNFNTSCWKFPPRQPRRWSMSWTSSFFGSFVFCNISSLSPVPSVLMGDW